jgi:hypothetical protein
MIFESPWMWLALGVLLMSLEVAVPGLHFLWFGVAATVVALLVWLGLQGLGWQIAVFGALSIMALYFGRRLMATAAVGADPENAALNERGQQYVGRTVVVEEAIRNGRGKVRVGDTLWLAEGTDVPAGARVSVKAARGSVLIVD